MCGNGIFFLEEVWELRYTEFLNFAHVWERIQFLEEVWEQRSHAFPPTLTTALKQYVGQMLCITDHTKQWDDDWD